MGVPRDILLDSDVLISLIKTGRLDVLGKLKGFRFCITDINHAEIRLPAQQHVLRAALGNGDLLLTPLIDPAGLSTFAGLRKYVDDGEAATIAQASVSRARLAMHDGAGRKAAVATLGTARIYRLEDIVVEAIREKVLDVPTADGLMALLRGANDYKTNALAGGYASILSDGRFGLAP